MISNANAAVFGLNISVFSEFISQMLFGALRGLCVVVLTRGVIFFMADFSIPVGGLVKLFM
jgi:hypothetical protein